MASVISGDANVSATEFGYLDGVTSALQTQMDAKLPIAGGKILQVVRATDTTARSTTSASYVDANISVTITPQKSTSAVLLINSLSPATIGSGTGCSYQITDASNNTISGAQEMNLAGGGTNLTTPAILIAYATPATTSPVTYKLRFKVFSGTNVINNGNSTGQMYAIEVSA